MKKDDALPKKYMQPTDFAEPRTLRLDTVTMHEFTNDGVKTKKPVAFFSDPATGKRLPQGLIINATRWDEFVAASGGEPDSEDWKNILYVLANQADPDKLYRGQPTITVSAAPADPDFFSPAPKAKPSLVEDMADEIPL